jgi:hypothetical protein
MASLPGKMKNATREMQTVARPSIMNSLSGRSDRDMAQGWVDIPLPSRSVSDEMHVLRDDTLEDSP